MTAACQKCGKLAATNHITVIMGSAFSEVHFCDPCYSSSPTTTGPGILRCDRCGSGFHDIQARGRMGCENDYKLFARDIAACVEKYHGSSQHVGKAPRMEKGSS